jgi:hypothetical protein
LSKKKSEKWKNLFKQWLMSKFGIVCLYIPFIKTPIGTTTKNNDQYEIDCVENKITVKIQEKAGEP